MATEGINKLPNETPDEYRIRLYTNQSAYGLNNKQVGELLNKAYGLDQDESAWRKRTRPYIQGYEAGLSASRSSEDVLEEIKKERIKLQTLNVERNRIDRQEARHELFYEMLADHIERCPKAEWDGRYTERQSSRKEYILTIGDIHYGYTFNSMNNEYSPEIAEKRLSVLAEEVCQYCKNNKIERLKIVNLGDNIHGILRVNDLRMNQSGVVAATIEVAQLLGKFISKLSFYVSKIDYYHVPESNHTQIRPLGTKASEIASEDVEYIITEFLKVKFCECPNVKINSRVGDTFITIPLFDYFAIAKHGHDIKSVETANKDLAYTIGLDVDYLFLGHFHSIREYSVGINTLTGTDRKTFLCPSIMGSDPYSDKILKGSCPGAEMFEFSKEYGHIGTKHFVL